MAAVTIAPPPRYRTGPTTRPRRRASRAVYLRRRVTAVAMGMAFVVAMAQAGAALGGSTLAAPERRPASRPHTIVRPGDSLWAIAQRLAPGEDPRPIVDALADARHGAPLVPGERVEWAG
jgi:hypothetical protein